MRVAAWSGMAPRAERRVRRSRANGSALKAIGEPIDRVDGRLKVTGAARYTADHPVPDVVHAVLVMSTIARGRVVEIDTSAAEAMPGVLGVMTHLNAPRLRIGKNEDGRVLQLLQDARVLYANQPIAVVVATTLEDAQEGAARVAARYLPEPHEVRMEPHLGDAYVPDDADGEGEPESGRGDARRVLDEAEVRIERLYTTPRQTHVPMEPHATVAMWEGAGRLTLHDATQAIHPERERVAKILGLRTQDVRVLAPFVGGSFGGKGPTWSHVVLAAMAARHVGRPVKLVLDRAQMFGPVGWRSPTRQTIGAGARFAGTLTALSHDTLAQTSTFKDYLETAGLATRMLYAVPNVATHHKLLRGDIGSPSYMRAPGWAPGTFALECAIDELAYALPMPMDPLLFRLANHADRDPEEDRPWSLKLLRECYALGAERFEWALRPIEPATLRDGHDRIGWGMATSVYPVYRSEASARARLQTDGTVLVEAGTHDVGTGTYTVMTQVAAAALGLPASRVIVQLGDTSLPEAPESGGSQTAASVGCAVHAAATALRRKVQRLHLRNWRPPRGKVIQASATASPGAGERYSAYAFGAQFAEVRVDVDLGTIRVSRMLGVFDCGRILNAKTAASQLEGGMVWGIGMALHEDAVLDTRLGRVVNGNLADYHVPVHLDVPDIEVAFVPGVDRHANPLGVKGVGEIGTTGAAAAIANAVWHATGKRVRDLPITLDTLL